MSAPAHDPDPEDVEVDGEEDAPAPTLAAVRERHPSAGRSRTIPASRKLSKREIHQQYNDLERKDRPLLVFDPRPPTRGECGQERPCPYVSCAMHLYLDVDENTGSLKLNFPEVEVWQMTFSCALDEADASGGEGMTLEQVATRTQLTRERVRQVESRITQKLREVTAEDGTPITRRYLRVIQEP